MIEEIRGMPYHAVSVAPMLESIKNGPTLSNGAACKGKAQLLAQLSATLQAQLAQESTDANSTQSGLHQSSNPAPATIRLSPYRPRLAWQE